MLTAERIAQLRQLLEPLPDSAPFMSDFGLEATRNRATIMWALRVAEAALPVVEEWRGQEVGPRCAALERAVRGGEEPLPEDQWRAGIETRLTALERSSVRLYAKGYL